MRACWDTGAWVTAHHFPNWLQPGLRWRGVRFSEVAHCHLSPCLSTGPPPGIQLNKHQPWWLLLSFQDGCLAVSHIADPYTAAAQPPPFLLAKMWTKETYESVHCVSFSPWRWFPSLYLEDLQSSSDLSSRGEMLQALNLASQKIHLALFDRHLRLSLKLLLFSQGFFDLQNPFLTFFSSSPEQPTQHIKDKASWRA